MIRKETGSSLTPAPPGYSEATGSEVVPAGRNVNSLRKLQLSGGDVRPAEAGIAGAPRPQFAAPSILSLCCLYPNPLRPGQGLFVQRRLQHLAELAPVRVVAPYAWVQYGNMSGERIQRNDVPWRRQEKELVVLHPRWFYPPFSGVWTPIWLFLQLLPVLRRVRKEFPFQLIDAHFGYPDGIAASLLAQALGVPFTVTLRGNEPKHSSSRIGRLCMARCLRKACRVFTVSERLREFAIRLGAAPLKVKTIPNGIDSSIFHPRDRDQLRSRYGFSADRPLLVSAGALVERKGHHRVIQALAGITAEGLSPQLAIVGGHGPEGAYEKTLRRLVADLGLEDQVRFMGRVGPDGLAELMSCADVLCLASTNEGWPNVVHEALACGTPVVATDVGAVPEMLAGGVYGVIVPVNDAAALQQGLADALRKNWDRRAISDWGLARSWRDVAQEVLEEVRTAVRQENT